MSNYFNIGWNNQMAYRAELRASFIRPQHFVAITGISDGYEPPRKTTPLWTRHMLGVREAERDRRKYGR